MTEEAARRRRRRNRIRTAGLAALAAGAVGVAGMLGWASSPMTAEAAPLAEVKADDALTVATSAEGVVLRPASPDGRGLVFLAGARVDPAAYAATFAPLADAGVTVVIARPILNFAIAEFRPLRDFEALAPGVESWWVGGHSLGGVRACQYAADAGGSDAGSDAVGSDAGSDAVAGVILLGSYCAVDLSESGLAVLSVSGSRDGLSTPAKVADARDLLPADATTVELDGVAHAQFGAYGDQPGDGEPTVSDADARAEIADAILGFLA